MYSPIICFIIHYRTSVASNNQVIDMTNEQTVTKKEKKTNCFLKKRKENQSTLNKVVQERCHEINRRI